MHELTEMIFYKALPETRAYYDSIIRTYLEEKAKELKEAVHTSWKLEPYYTRMGEILGLTDSPKEPCYYHSGKSDRDIDCNCEKNHYKPTATAETVVGEKKVVCDPEHHHEYFIVNRINTCPHCGQESPVVVRERPKSKTLEEKVAERMKDYSSAVQLPRLPMMTPGDWWNLASTAIQAVRTHDKETHGSNTRSH